MSKEVAKMAELPSFNAPKEPGMEHYALAHIGDVDIAAIIRENLGDQSIRRFDLDQIKVPSGGGTRFEISSIEGVESVEEVEGVIIHWMIGRNYWSRPLDEGETAPPDCTSDDGDTGFGSPGGDCYACPLSKFGSATKGDGQACKENRVLFFLRPGQLIPSVVSVPPTSIANNKSYMLGLASRAVSFWKTGSIIRLQTEKNAAGVKYSEMTFSMGKRLNEKELAMLDAYRKSFLKTVSQMSAADFVNPQEVAPAAEKTEESPAAEA